MVPMRAIVFVNDFTACVLRHLVALILIFQY